MSYPCTGLACCLPHVLRHVRGQPCPRDTWPESLRGQGRFPAASSPVAAATAVYLFFRRMAAGVHGNNALDPSPIKRVHLHLPSTTATASLLTWLAGLCRGCGFSICVWDKRAFLCFDSLNTSFLLSHMAQCLCLAVRLSRLGEEIGRHAVPWPHSGGLLWLASRVRQSVYHHGSSRLGTCPPVGAAEGDCGERSPPLPLIRCRVWQFQLVWRDGAGE